MKKSILLMMAFCVLTFVGCSVESSSESIENETQLVDNTQTVTIQITDFKIVGSGIFESSSSKACNTKGELINRGQSNTGEFGKLSAEYSICTDFEGTNYFAGSYTTTNGDQFDFTSNESGVDEFGTWYLFNIEGGTGVFANATGEITIYRTERFNTELDGSFTDYGKGIIHY